MSIYLHKMQFLAKEVIQGKYIGCKWLLKEINNIFPAAMSNKWFEWQC
jgi:hypothetical protein